MSAPMASLLSLHHVEDTQNVKVPDPRDEDQGGPKWRLKGENDAAEGEEASSDGSEGMISRGI